MSDWLSPATVLSAAALVISLAGLRYTQRVEARQALLDEPIVSVALTETEWNGWYRLSLLMRNRTEARWMVDTIEVPNWDAARMGLEPVVRGALPPNLGVGLPDRSKTDLGPTQVGVAISPAAADHAGELELHLLLSIERPVGLHAVPIRLVMHSLADMRRIERQVLRSVTPVSTSNV